MVDDHNLLGHDFRQYLIEREYGISANPSTLINPTYNAVLKRIQQVLGNLVCTFNIKQTYVDK